ncbi:MAG: hypothetical protein ACK5HP_03540 [Bacilli bacterium]
MNNEEYKYSFKVKTLDPFIQYCEKNNYEKIEESKQIRKLFKKEDKTMARITIKEKNGSSKKLFDFKDDNMSDEVLIVRRESLPINLKMMKRLCLLLIFLDIKRIKF